MSLVLRNGQNIFLENNSHSWHVQLDDAICPPWSFKETHRPTSLLHVLYGWNIQKTAAVLWRLCKGPNKLTFQTSMSETDSWSNKYKSRKYGFSFVKVVVIVTWLHNLRVSDGRQGAKMAPRRPRVRLPDLPLCSFAARKIHPRHCTCSLEQITTCRYSQRTMLVHIHADVGNLSLSTRSRWVLFYLKFLKTTKNLTICVCARVHVVDTVT